MAKIIGGIILVLVVGGAFFLWQGKSATAPITETVDTTPTETETGLNESGVGMIASIKDAMGLGKTLQCTYALNEGGATMGMMSTVMVDGEKFKSTTVMKDMTMYALFDGENQYTWMSNSKEGMKMSKACLAKMTDTVKNLPQSPAAPSQPKNVSKDFEMAKNVQCEVSGSVDLSLPVGITFTDQCAIVEQSMKMLEQMKEAMPGEVTMPVMPNVAY